LGDGKEGGVTETKVEG